jgi:hypothetical protein
MEFTEAESNMHDLVSPIGGSTTNDRLLNTNNTKMPQSRQQRSMMKNHMLRKLRNKDLCLCDTTRCGFIFNFPNYSMLQLFTNASVNPTEAFNDRCSGFFMHLPTTLIGPESPDYFGNPFIASPGTQAVETSGSEAYCFPCRGGLEPHWDKRWAEVIFKG